MNYEKIYKDLVESRKLLDRNKKDGTYYEIHHILPKSLGGSNDKDNLVFLTAKEHFVAHLLLTHFLKGKDRSKMVYALWRLATSRSSVRKETFSSRTYETAKRILSEERKKIRLSLEIKNKMSISQKERWLNTSEKRKKEIALNVSLSKKGKPSSLKGSKKPLNVCEKTSNTMKGRTLESFHGVEKAKEIREKQSKAQIGKKQPEDQIRKRILTLKENKKKEKDAKSTA